MSNNNVVTRPLKLDEQVRTVCCCLGVSTEVTFHAAQNEARSRHTALSLLITKLGNKLPVLLGHVDAHEIGAGSLEHLCDLLLEQVNVTIVNRNGTYFVDCSLGRFEKFRQTVGRDSIQPFLGPRDKPQPNLTRELVRA